MNFQKIGVIETTETGSSAEELEDIFHTNMKSTNPMDRLFAVSKLSTLLRNYITKDVGKDFDRIDTRLIFGMYQGRYAEGNFLKR